MMMNIRGLVLEDPEHTAYLQTLNFATVAPCGESGPEHDMVVWTKQFTKAKNYHCQ